jgi:hypothetical protein
VIEIIGFKGRIEQDKSAVGFWPESRTIFDLVGVTKTEPLSISPWLNKEQTSCELEYNSEEDGVAGVTDN